MATWMSHIRIAENLLRDHDYDRTSFIIGNLAPDCGLPKEDNIGLSPPKDVTHWVDKKFVINRCIDETKIMPEIFYKKYLSEPDKLSKKEYSFLMGYYTHLLSDVCWANLHQHIVEKHESYREKLDSNPDSVSEVEDDWYALDFMYLEENVAKLDNTIVDMNDVESYLCYLPKESIIAKYSAIVDFYKKKENKPEYSGKYLSKFTMDNYIRTTTHFISNKLKLMGEKGIQ